MVYPVDVIDLVVSAEGVALAREQATLAEIGGKSCVRAEKQARDGKLAEDQVVGQLGQLALSLYMTGGAVPYLMQRQFCNRYPKEGDGGSDIPGTNLDAKGSLMRAGSNPLRYNLLVRPKERQPGKVYVLTLLRGVPPPGRAAGVHLVGWASDDMLPDSPEDAGPFQGAYRLPAEQLHPLPPIRWWSVV